MEWQGKAGKSNGYGWQSVTLNRAAKAMQRIERICKGVEKQRIAKARKCNEWNW